MKLKQTVKINLMPYQFQSFILNENWNSGCGVCGKSLNKNDQVKYKNERKKYGKFDTLTPVLCHNSCLLK